MNLVILCESGDSGESSDSDDSGYSCETNYSCDFGASVLIIRIR